MEEHLTYKCQVRLFLTFLRFLRQSRCGKVQKKAGLEFYKFPLGMTE